MWSKETGGHTVSVLYASLLAKVEMHSQPPVFRLRVMAKINFKKNQTSQSIFSTQDTEKTWGIQVQPESESKCTNQRQIRLGRCCEQTTGHKRRGKEPRHIWSWRAVLFFSKDLAERRGVFALHSPLAVHFWYRVNSRGPCSRWLGRKHPVICSNENFRRYQGKSVWVREEENVNGNSNPCGDWIMYVPVFLLKGKGKLWAHSVLHHTKARVTFPVDPVLDLR